MTKHSSKCSIDLPKPPSGDYCSNPIPDCFAHAYPQLGSSINQKTASMSEDAFAMRYDKTFFSNKPSVSAKGGGKRTKRTTRRSGSKATRSRTRKSSNRRVRQSRRRNRKRNPGGGYYFDLSKEAMIAGLPARVRYNDLAPPYFGGKALAKGAPCQPRTYSRKNVGHCNRTLH
jgi:hypothetical protein